MFNLFGKKQPLSIRELLLAIEKCRTNFPDHDFLSKKIANKLCDDLVVAIEKKWTPQHIANYEANINLGEFPEGFIYNYLTYSAANAMESGRYHIYRGVLNLEGKSYETLFEHSIAKSIELNIYTGDWAKVHLKDRVYKNVKEIG